MMIRMTAVLACVIQRTGMNNADICNTAMYFHKHKKQ